LAAGYSISAGREIVCEVGFSGPRRNSASPNALGAFSLEKHISFKSSGKLKFFTKRILDYLLRISTKTTGPESFLLYRFLVSLLSSLYFSIYYKSFVRLSLSKGVGFYGLPIFKGNQMIVGYFQSYKYLAEDDRVAFLKMLTLSDPGPDWKYWNSRASQERPIVVHIRLGDYLLEHNFGIVTTSYITNCLLKMGVPTIDRPIWVFSDQRELAQSIFPKQFIKNVVWVPEIDADPVATLSIMQLGADYVIANSTFSWWAAWSRREPGATVLCPDPWFSRSQSPKELLPEGWIKVDSDYENQK
jgi:hypothetical protein